MEKNQYLNSLAELKTKREIICSQIENCRNNLSINIGVWGQRRKLYLKQHRPILYTNLLTSCKLSEHLADIEEECRERMDSLVKDMAKQEGVIEVLKVADKMAWVRRMNNVRNLAEEIVLDEIVYE